MQEIDKLIALKDQLGELKSKLNTIGQLSLHMIKRCERIDIDKGELRDCSIKINYIAHEMYDIIDKNKRK